MKSSNSRRSFLQNLGLGSLGAVAAGSILNAASASPPDVSILGVDGVKTAPRPKGVWKPVSDRRIRVGIAGYGVCKFGAAFGFQSHPNVTVAAVSDLFPDRCQELAKACRCKKTYPSLEEMVKDDSLEAIFLATDAPHHAEHAILALNHGKHVSTAVPAAWGSIEDAHKLYETVKATGRKYMMFESSAFRADCYAMRQIFKAGGFGKLIYSEGEYFHHNLHIVDSYKQWRIGMPPQWYPTHSNAYYVCVTGGSFTEVSCLGVSSLISHYRPENNRYQNPFGSEIALMRTSEGGAARMAVSWDSHLPGGEVGRVRGQRGAMWAGAYNGEEKNLPELTCPPLPKTVDPGGHGGSHGQLMNEFVTAILQDRQPLVNVAWALNMTVAGVIAHQSALKGGELLKIPQFEPLRVT